MIKTEHKVIRKVQTYLCFKSIINQQTSLIRKIESLNLVIKASSIAMLSVVLAPKAKIAKKVASQAQNTLLFNYFRKIITLKNCHKKDKFQFILNSPYDLKKKRTLLGLMSLKNKKWNIYLFRIKENPYLLRAKLKAYGHGDKRIWSTLDEISGAKVLPIWKQLFGSLLQQSS